MWKWLLILILTFAGLSASPAAAEENVDMSVELPFGGIVKMNQWIQLQITLVNHGDAFDGQIVLSGDDFKPSEAKLRQPVSLKQGETRQFRLTLPSSLLMYQSTSVQLRDDETIVQSQKLPQLSDEPGRRVGVLADSANAFHFLAISDSALHDAELREKSEADVWIIRHLTPESLPEMSPIYKNLDLLAIGPMKHGQINDRQLAAVKEWVSTGGVLILSAGPGDDEIVRRFSDVLGIPAGAGGTISDLDQLRELSGQRQLPVQSLPVYNRNVPLFVAKQVGAGCILFVNYDVSAEPLASWQYNRPLWQHVLATYQLVDRSDESDPFQYSVRDLSKWIPGVSTPSVEWIIGIWLIYLLLVAWVLYLVLKRFDRREWAWAIIPTLAILLTAGVLTIGRAQVVKQDTGYSVTAVRIVEDKLAEAHTMASFLTVKGGSYTVRTEKGYLAAPIGGTTLGRLDGLSTINSDGEETRFTYEHVPYLSMKQAVATGVRKDIGSFAYRLAVEQDRLRGTIKNNTSMDLTDVYVEMGMQRIAVGPLRKGEEKQVDARLEHYYLANEPADSANTLRKPTREETVKRLMEEAIHAGQSNQMRIIGLSNQDLPVFAVEHREFQPNYLTIVSQAIRLSPNQDHQIVYPFGSVEPQAKTEGMTERIAPNLYAVRRGSITFALPATLAEGKATRMEIPLEAAPYRPFEKEIYHAKSGAWKPLPREQRVVLTGDLSEYVNRDGQVLIRFRNNTDQRLSLPTPFFQIEGKVRSR